MIPIINFRNNKTTSTSQVGCLPRHLDEFSKNKYMCAFKHGLKTPYVLLVFVAEDIPTSHIWLRLLLLKFGLQNLYLQKKNSI